MFAPTTGQRAADAFAGLIGSWRFIIGQSVILVAWIAFNMVFFRPWDPYPFILLNLGLSFQAAYSGPILLMSANRQAQIDRETLNKDYWLDEKAEKELQEVLKRLSGIEDRLNG